MSKGNAGIIEIDIHGKNAHQAAVLIDAALRRSTTAYRIRIIHGFHQGTVLRDLVRTRYTAHNRVLRIDSAASDGWTELVLREY